MRLAGDGLRRLDQRRQSVFVTPAVDGASDKLGPGVRQEPEVIGDAALAVEEVGKGDGSRKIILQHLARNLAVEVVIAFRCARGQGERQHHNRQSGSSHTHGGQLGTWFHPPASGKSKLIARAAVANPQSPHKPGAVKLHALSSYGRIISGLDSIPFEKLFHVGAHDNAPAGRRLGKRNWYGDSGQQWKCQCNSL